MKTWSVENGRPENRLGSRGQAGRATVVPGADPEPDPEIDLALRPAPVPGLRARMRGLRHSERRPAAPQGKGGGMEVVHARVAGLDVHKRSVQVCVLQTGPAGAVERQ